MKVQTVSGVLGKFFVVDGMKGGLSGFRGLREELLLQVRLDLFPDVMVGDAIRFRDRLVWVQERFSAGKPRDVHRCDRARS